MRLHAHVPYVCVRGGGAYVFICAYAQNNTVMQTSDPCNTRVVVWSGLYVTYIYQSMRKQAWQIFGWACDIFNMLGGLHLVHAHDTHGYTCTVCICIKLYTVLRHLITVAVLHSLILENTCTHTSSPVVRMLDRISNQTQSNKHCYKPVYSGASELRPPTWLF